MNIMKFKLMAGVVLMLGIAVFANTASRSVSDDSRGPEIPDGCDINVPEGYKVAFHVYAIGVQIYRWNGAAWVFIAPEANLFASRNFRGLVGTHYVGPTWETNSGSTVVGSAPISCTPDSTAIPWLRLTAASSSGPGVLDDVKFIHRVNTAGGLRPTIPGTVIDQEVRVPYTAEYYFYKSRHRNDQGSETLDY